MLIFEKTNYDLSARILSGEATSAEVTTHEQWLAADPLHRQEWDEMVHAWNVASDAVRFQDVDVNEGWSKVKHDLKTNVKPAWYTMVVYQRIAAAVILLFAAASVLWVLKPFEKTDYHEIAIYSPNGEEVVLPDGSTVTLSAESSIAYTSPFRSDQRSVRFSGEAFFQIQGDPKWPFVVETVDITVKVIGTAFNVRSWPGQQVSFVDVSSGTVEVAANSVDLSPVKIVCGHRAVYDHKNGLLEKRMADPNFLSWKTRKIEFQNVPLNHVFETLENVYRVKIQVSDVSILNERMGATFSHNTLEYITGVVCETFELECKDEQGVLFFSRKKS